MPKTYHGTLDEDANQVVVVKTRLGTRPLVELRYDPRARRYVPGDNGGFAWGYGGTGPHNLARALLADVFGRRRINQHDGNALVSDYAWQRITALPASGGRLRAWSLSEDEIRAWERARRREADGTRPEPVRLSLG